MKCIAIATCSQKFQYNIVKNDLWTENVCVFVCAFTYGFFFYYFFPSPSYSFSSRDCQHINEMIDGFLKCTEMLKIQKITNHKKTVFGCIQVSPWQMPALKCTAFFCLPSFTFTLKFFFKFSTLFNKPKSVDNTFKSPISGWCMDFCPFIFFFLSIFPRFYFEWLNL